MRKAHQLIELHEIEITMEGEDQLLSGALKNFDIHLSLLVKTETNYDIDESGGSSIEILEIFIDDVRLLYFIDFEYHISSPDMSTPDFGATSLGDENILSKKSPGFITFIKSKLKTQKFRDQILSSVN